MPVTRRLLLCCCWVGWLVEEDVEALGAPVLAGSALPPLLVVALRLPLLAGAVEPYYSEKEKR